MQGVPMCALLMWILLISSTANSEDEEVKQALVKFMDNLTQVPANKDANFGWNLTSDPCNDKWAGVTCDSSFTYVKNIVLDGFNLTGVFDTTSLCVSPSLLVVSLQKNRFQGLLTEDIGKCRSLTHLYINGNTFSGDLPNSLAKLVNLKRLDISENDFSGVIPDLSPISGLITFHAQNNNLSGQLPNFDFSNLDKFNVSNNNLSGPIPDVKDRFHEDSFTGNPKLCGPPLLNACPAPSPSQTPPLIPTPPPPAQESSLSFGTYSGFMILAAIALLFFIFKIVMYCKSKRKTSNRAEKERLGVNTSTSNDKRGGSSNGSKNTKGNRSEYSVSSDLSSSSLTILSTAVFKQLRFQDLLRAPAELIGRGKNGSLYKVMIDNWPALVVKRIKDWQISKEEFEWRMYKIDKVKHPFVLPPIAFYCSQQEKLLVYEYQQKGSLFQLLHGSQNDRKFDWGSRLHVAACIAEGLAHMHHELLGDRLAHGNLKSTNILFNKNTDPCISEYGLVMVENQDQPILSQTRSLRYGNTSVNLSHGAFKADVYAYGVLLLELLTGKLVQNNGFDLADWVNSVVREEWTVEVFDRALMLDGASEERMVNLLQIAMKCVNAQASDRPTMTEVAVMILGLKEEDERSIAFENNI